MMIFTAGVGTGLLLVALLTPAWPAAGRLAARAAAAVRTLGGGPGDTTVMPPGMVPPGAVQPGTSPAVGALFHITGHITSRTTNRGDRPQLGSHFCTASVVNSPSGDLVMTAAHCVSGLAAGQIAFVPGYRDGATPFGVWTVTSVIVDRAWLAAASPDDDVAFLVVRRAGTAASVQSFTGGERLGIGQPVGQLVQVTGYPQTTGAPVTCLNRANWLSPAQMQFDTGRRHRVGVLRGPAGAPGRGSVQSGDLPPVPPCPVVQPPAGNPPARNAGPGCVTGRESD